MPRKRRISPEDYARTLQGMEIQGVDVDSFSGKLHDRDRLISPQGSVTVSIADKERFQAEEGQATVWHTYTVEVTSTEEEPPRRLLTLRVEFRVAYSSKEPFTS